jgi:hypothetical protein
MKTTGSKETYNSRAIADVLRKFERELELRINPNDNARPQTVSFEDNVRYSVRKRPRGGLVIREANPIQNLSQLPRTPSEELLLLLTEIRLAIIQIRKEGHEFEVGEREFEQLKVSPFPQNSPVEKRPFQSLSVDELRSSLGSLRIKSKNDQFEYTFGENFSVKKRSYGELSRSRTTNTESKKDEAKERQ